MSISTQLEKTAEIVSTRGWRRGGMKINENPDTCTVCLFSALAVAQGRLPIYWFCATESRAGQFLEKEIGVNVDWNDGRIDPSVGKETVLDVLKAAAHLAKEMGL